MQCGYQLQATISLLSHYELIVNYLSPVQGLTGYFTCTVIYMNITYIKNILELCMGCMPQLVLNFALNGLGHQNFVDMSG